VLREHLLLTGRRGSDLLLGRTAELPFTPAAVGARADRAWKAAKPKLARYTLHEARHSAVSFMCASGADAATIMSWIGHVDERMLAHYRHALKARVARAVEDADALLTQAGAGS
jgi:integrase